MFDKNLDISIISPQPAEQNTKRTLLEKDTSLEEILDEITKQESSPKKTSTPLLKIQKGRTLVIKPTQQVPSLLLGSDPVFSSNDHIKQVQFTRRDNKGMTAPVLQCAPTKSSLEMIHNIPEYDTRTTNLPSSQLSGSESPDQQSPSLRKRRSKLLNKDLQLDPANFRRLSNPNVDGQKQSPTKLFGSPNPLANMMPNAPNSYTGPRFNVYIPESLSQTPSIRSNRPDLAGNQFTNSPKSARSLGKHKSIQPKLDSPFQGPINGDYLAKILQKGGATFGSQSGSTGTSTPGDSPRSADLAEKNELRLVKRGSFSVFRKIAEAELVKNP